MHVDRKSVPRNPVGEISCAPCGELNKFVAAVRSGGAIFMVNFIARGKMSNHMILSSQCSK